MILHNHVAFVQELAKRVRVDLTPVIAPELVPQRPQRARKSTTREDGEEEEGEEDEEGKSASDEEPRPRPAGRPAPRPPARVAADPAATTATAPRSQAAVRITMALGPGLGKEELVDTMDRFMAGLGMISMTLRRNNQLVQGVTLAENEIRLITSFFFKEVFGPGARGRIAALIAYCENAGGRGIELGSGERASALAIQAEIPEAFRAFFYNFGRLAQGSRSNTTVHAKILSHWHQYRLYGTFESLQRTAETDPAQYQAFLQSQGLTMGIGQGATTAIFSYLTRSLDMERGRLRNVLQQSQSIHLLACTFGPGVLALLPTNASHL